MTRLVAIVFLILLPQVARAERYALLVGAAHFPNAPKILPLDGPVNDVEALRAELLRSWKVSAEKITALVDVAASRDGILAALDAMAAKAVSGDEVLLYYSGYGTSPQDPNSPILGLNIVTSAIVPADIRESSNTQETISRLIVGFRDLRPRLERLDQKNVRVLVVFDTGYSGESAKSIAGLRPRNINLLGDAVASPETLRAFGADPRQGSPMEQLSFRNIVYISATARHELAWDIPSMEARTRRPTVDGKAHGAFTNALLRGMQGAADTDHDRKISYSELHGFLVNQLQREGQTPQLQPQSGDLMQQTFLPSSAQAAGASYASKQLRVWLSIPNQAMTERLKLVGRIELVNDNAYDLEIRSEGSGYRIFHPSGAATTAKTLSTAETLRLVEKRAAANPFITLTFPMQDFNVAAAMDPDYGAYYEREQTKLQLQPSRDSWILVLDLDAESNLYLVYPHEPGDFRKISAGETVAAAHFVSAMPFGLETLQVFAFAQKPDFYDALMGILRLTDTQAIAVLERLERDASSPGRAQTQRMIYTLAR